MTSSRPYSLPPPAPALAKEHDESKPVHPTSTPSRDSEEPPFRDRLQAPALRYRICALVESIFSGAKELASRRMYSDCRSAKALTARFFADAQHDIKVLSTTGKRSERQSC
jgi:hypothetical protein